MASTFKIIPGVISLIVIAFTLITLCYANPVPVDVWSRIKQLPNNLTCTSIRVRREVTSLTSEEFERFASAVRRLNAGDHPTAFDTFTLIYMNNSRWVQGSDAFFPWNRLFLWTFEEALRTVDPGVTIPYWDWSMTNTPEKSPVFGQDFCGGNGDPKYNMSVTSGMFAAWQVQYPEPHYLRREFSGNVTNDTDTSAGGLLPSFYVKEIIDSIIYNINGDMYSSFRQMIAMANGNVLAGIGGDMAELYASNDPLFYLCIAFIDYIYYKYQQRGPPYNNIPSLDITLNPFNSHSSSVMDASKQLCYTYEDPPSYALIKGYLDSLDNPPIDQLVTIQEELAPTLTCTWIPITTSATTNYSNDSTCITVPTSCSTCSSTMKSKLSFTEYYCTGYESPCPCSTMSITNSTFRTMPSTTPLMTKSCYYVYPNGSIPSTTPNLTTIVTVESGVIVTVIKTLTDTVTRTDHITKTITTNTPMRPPNTTSTCSCVELIRKFSCNPDNVTSCDIPSLDPKLVMLCNGIVKSIDEAPIPNTTFSMDINWNYPLSVLLDQLSFMAGRLNGSTLCPLDLYDRNDTLLLRGSESLPQKWINDNGLNEGLVRMQEKVMNTIVQILNLETLRGSFLSAANPVLQEKIIRAYPSLCRGMPIEIVREEVITVNKTKIVNAPIPKVIVDNQTATFDPLANISTNQLQSLPCYAIQSLINQDDPRNLSSIISSLLLVPQKPASTCTTTLRVMASPTPLSPSNCKNLLECGGNPACGSCPDNNSTFNNIPPISRTLTSTLSQ